MNVSALKHAVFQDAHLGRASPGLALPDFAVDGRALRQGSP